MRQGPELPGLANQNIKPEIVGKAKRIYLHFQVKDRVELVEQPEPQQKPKPTATLETQQKASEVVAVKLTPERADCGKALRVHWEHSAEPTSRDWIALFMEGCSDKDYVTYEWVSQRKGNNLLIGTHLFRRNYLQCPSYLW